MRSSLLTGVIITGVFLAAAGAYAQSLGDVARKEEARRRTVKKPSRVYTNDNLKEVAPPADATPASQEPQAAAAAASETPAPAAAPARSESPRDEKYWRGRLDAARTSLSRAQTLQEALQSRINVLSADFVNRDDPAQRNVIAADRQKALAELDRVKQEIAQHQKAIVDIQEEGRRAGVPAGWLR
jgi:gas vesicle protein